MFSMSQWKDGSENGLFKGNRLFVTGGKWSGEKGWPFPQTMLSPEEWN
jgi:hypothetical protein